MWVALLGKLAVAYVVTQGVYKVMNVQGNQGYGQNLSGSEYNDFDSLSQAVFHMPASQFNLYGQVEERNDNAFNWDQFLYDWLETVPPSSGYGAYTDYPSDPVAPTTYPPVASHPPVASRPPVASHPSARPVPISPSGGPIPSNHPQEPTESGSSTKKKHKDRDESEEGGKKKDKDKHKEKKDKEGRSKSKDKDGHKEKKHSKSRDTDGHKEKKDKDKKKDKDGHKERKEKRREKEAGE